MQLLTNKRNRQWHNVLHVARLDHSGDQSEAVTDDLRPAAADA